MQMMSLQSVLLLKGPNNQTSKTRRLIAFTPSSRDVTTSQVVPVFLNMKSNYLVVQYEENKAALANLYRVLSVCQNRQYY
jgi:hypothetical protein